MATDYAAKIAALEEAVASGELTIKSDGREVTYRSMDDLMRALAYCRSRQTQASPGGGEVYGVTLATFGCD
jgi:hypothetical protein